MDDLMFMRALLAEQVDRAERTEAALAEAQRTISRLSCRLIDGKPAYEIEAENERLRADLAARERDNAALVEALENSIPEHRANCEACGYGAPNADDCSYVTRLRSLLDAALAPRTEGEQPAGGCRPGCCQHGDPDVLPPCQTFRQSEVIPETAWCGDCGHDLACHSPEVPNAD